MHTKTHLAEQRKNGKKEAKKERKERTERKAVVVFFLKEKSYAKKEKKTMRQRTAP